MIKKILYVRNGPYKVNPNLYNLQEIGFCKVLCNKGFNCDIIYYSDENKDECIYEYEGRKVNLLWRKGYKLLRTGLYPSLLKESFVNRYDFIVTTEYSQIMSLLWTKFKPKVVLYNGPYYNLFKIPALERIYDFLFVNKLAKRLDKVFTKSNLAKKYLEDKGFSNVETLGVGLDTTTFNSVKEVPDNVKEIEDFMKNNRCILYVGSLEQRKNFDFTLNVFEAVKKEKNEIKLVVVGKGKKEYVNRCFNSISKEVYKDILHIEKIDNRYLQYLYKNTEVFILPSSLEIFGMVLLEAMYFGAPTITTVNGGSTTLIKNMENGIIMDGFHIEKWTKMIVHMLEDENYRNRISNNAKKTIDDNFTWEKISEKFIMTIENL